MSNSFKSLKVQEIKLEIKIQLQICMNTFIQIDNLFIYNNL